MRYTDLSLNNIGAVSAKRVQEIADITKEYRNKAAHTNELKRVNAEQCFKLMIDVEKFLRRILDSFDH